MNTTDYFLAENYKQGILAHHNIYQFESIIPLIFFVVFENAISFLAFLLLEQFYIFSWEIGLFIYQATRVTSKYPISELASSCVGVVNCVYAWYRKEA